MARTMAGNPITKFRTFLFDGVLTLERHEYVAVAWSFAYFFCVLSSYYVIRPVREMMAVGGGPDTIPFLFIGTFLTMLLVAPVFGWIASRYPRRVFLPWVYLFFASNVLIFWAIFSLAVDQGKDYDRLVDMSDADLGALSGNATKRLADAVTEDELELGVNEGRQAVIVSSEADYGTIRAYISWGVKRPRVRASAVPARSRRRRWSSTPPSLASIPCARDASNCPWSSAGTRNCSCRTIPRGPDARLARNDGPSSPAPTRAPPTQRRRRGGPCGRPRAACSRPGMR